MKKIYLLITLFALLSNMSFAQPISHPDNDCLCPDFGGFNSYNTEVTFTIFNVDSSYCNPNVVCNIGTWYLEQELDFEEKYYQGQDMFGSYHTYVFPLTSYNEDNTISHVTHYYKFNYDHANCWSGNLSFSFNKIYYTSSNPYNIPINQNDFSFVMRGDITCRYQTQQTASNDSFTLDKQDLLYEVYDISGRFLGSTLESNLYNDFERNKVYILRNRENRITKKVVLQ